MTTPPAYFDGVLFVGLPFSENLIRGGLVIAADGKTGAIKWVFNTVPQGPQDEGWDIARDTWIGGARLGGGIWTQPAIDPELGLLYVNASNPAIDYDGSARHGLISSRTPLSPCECRRAGWRGTTRPFTTTSGTTTWPRARCCST